MYMMMMTLIMCCQTDEDGEIYMSVMQLRDQTDALQSEIDRRAKTGDTVGAEACQQQLTRVQQQLLEKNQIRSVQLFHLIYCHYFFAVIISLCPIIMDHAALGRSFVRS